MPLTKPYQGLSNNRLTELINKDNNTTLVEGVDFNYGTLSVKASSGGRNTSIELNPADTNQFTPVTVNYTRLQIGVLDLLPKEMKDYVNLPSLPVSTHDILEEINRALGLNLTTSEVQNIEYTDNAAKLPLTILAGSLAWLPSTYYFKVRTEDMILSENGDPLLTENGFPFELESA